MLEINKSLCTRRTKKNTHTHLHTQHHSANGHRDFPISDETVRPFNFALTLAFALTIVLTIASTSFSSSLTRLLNKGDASSPLRPTKRRSRAMMPPLLRASAARSATPTISALKGEAVRAVRAATTDRQVLESWVFGGVGGRRGEERWGDWHGRRKGKQGRSRGRRGSAGRMVLLLLRRGIGVFVVGLDSGRYLELRVWGWETCPFVCWVCWVCLSWAAEGRCVCGKKKVSRDR